MGRVKASVEIGVLASTAEELWYDTRRWAAFVDGLAHVAKVEGDWPRSGRVVWDSHHGGRGRVVERVERYEARAGQTVTVEDENVHGTQRVTFEPTARGCRVMLQFEYQLKTRRGGRATQALADLFTRRPTADGLRRTLVRFRRELETPD
jgi:hypothetical protein